MIAMPTFCIFLLSLLLFPGLLPSEALGGKVPPVKCASCHKTAKILPASHKAYSLKATDRCFSCHKVEGKAAPLGEKIHSSHLEKSPATMKNCFACHQADRQGEVAFAGRPGMKASKEAMPGVAGYFESWNAPDLLAGSHRRNGVYCLDCHSDYMDAYAAGDTQAGCTGCHGGTEEMIKKTEKTKYSHNPHKSHYVDLKCSACHSGHKPFVDYCAQCHPFGYRDPRAR